MRRTNDKTLTVICAVFLLASLTTRVSLAQQTARIDSVNPSQAAPGQIVMITGSGFGARNVRITVGGVPAQVTSATGSRVSFAVPQGVACGPTVITATNPGGQPGHIAFVVCESVNAPPVVDAGPDLTVTSPTATTLNGTVSDDGRPSGAPPSVQWKKVSGPGIVTLGNASSTNTTASFSQAGRYVMRLTASDSELTASDEATVDVTPANRTPVANAGPDQTAPVATTVTLDATGSSDMDGDALTYQWAIMSAPAGSAITLSDPSALRPTFVIDQPGSHVLQLVVHDGVAYSEPDTVVVSTVNSAPVANAGPDQKVFVTQTVTLNGDHSSDVDGDPLTFGWTLVSAPEASSAVLANPTSVTPTFVVDKPGVYVAQLSVNDGTAASAPDTVTITTANSAPVANAGADQSTLVNQTVMLDGSGSTDVDGDPLTYAWSLVSVPIGSSASVSDPTAVAPTFVADRPGTYVAQLIVSEPNAMSAPDTVTITTLNSAPVADAGLDQTMAAGQVVFLDGAGSSDVDGDPLTFQWSLTSAPAGSSAVLVNPTGAAPTFIVDQPGTFVAQLIVNDGTVGSAPDTVTINTTNSTPVANAGADQLNARGGASVTLDGSLSNDADGHTLTYSWSLTAKPAGSAAVLSDPTAVGPTFTADIAGDYVAQLLVSDGFSNSTPDTVLIRAAEAPPITLTTSAVGGGLQTGNLNGLLGDANHGGVTVRLVSSDPNRVVLAANALSAGSASIDIPVANGLATFSYYVQGLDWIDGASSAALVTVTASATGFRNGSATINYVRPVLDVINLPSSTTSLSANIDVVARVGVPTAANTMQTLQARRFGAPALVVTASNSNAAVAEIDHNGGIDGAQTQTSTIVAGQSTTPNNAADGFEFDPLAGGTTTVTAAIPGFITLPAGVHTVTVSGPGINMPSAATIGGGLQTGFFQGNLGASNHGGVTVRLQSNDPSRVLVALNGTSPGAASIDIVVATGATSFMYFLQGTDWVEGESSAQGVTVTATAPGFSQGTSLVNYVRPVLDVVSLPATTTALAANTNFAVRVGVPTLANTMQTLQARRFGAAPLVVTATNSNAGVAEIDQNGGLNGAQVQTSSIVAGQSTTPFAAAGGFEFDPLGTGTTIVRASIPNFSSLPSGTVTVTVAAPTITLPPLEAIGGGLMYGAYSGTLSGSQHGGVQVHLVSSDPSRVLLAATSTSPGAAEIDIPVANGATAFTFFVVGTDWVDGVSSSATVTVTATASGFTSAGATINYIRPTLDIGNLPASLSATSLNRDFTIRVGIPNAANTGLKLFQWRRPGAADLVVTVTNSSAGSAEIDQNGGLNGAQVQTARIVAGQSTTPFNAPGGLEFDPVGTGSTVLTATIPNFAMVPAAGFAVNVTP